MERIDQPMKHWLDRTTHHFPDNIAVIYENTKLTFKQLRKKSLEYAGALSKLDLEGKKHVGILMENSPEYIFLLYALMYTGCITVPLNTRLHLSELRSQIKTAELGLLITDREVEFENLQVISVKDLDLEMIPEKLIKPLIDGSKLHSIIFTTGSTKRPKAVMLSYNNHFHSAMGSEIVHGVAINDIWLNCLPLFHVGGLEIVFRNCIRGKPFVLHPRFDENEIIESINRYKVTIISLVPTMLSRLLDTGMFEKNSLRFILLGGAKASDTLIAKCIDEDLPIAVTYGMTEACSQIATAELDLLKSNPKTVGPPLFQLKVRIKKNDKTKNYGKILIKGPMITKGYYGLESEREKYFEEDYFITGDIGYVDENGFLYVLQRQIDMIISGGENILPLEVEEIIQSFPGIRDVVVFGLQDEKWGQVVAAAVVPEKKFSRKDLLAHCRSKLAGYKIPKQIRIFAQFPEKGIGKIDRKMIIETYNSAEEIV